MENFLILEGGLLIISAFFLAVTAFTSTRSFSPEGSFKRTFPMVLGILVIVIIWHYVQTVDRIETVTKEFEKGKVIICENKGNLKLGRSVLVDKNREGWEVVDDYFFISKEYSRKFHISRCVVHLVQKDNI